MNRGLIYLIGTETDLNLMTIKDESGDDLHQITTNTVNQFFYSIPVSILLPPLGLALAADSIVRVYRNINYDYPIGLIGSVREVYRSLRTKPL